MLIRPSSDYPLPELVLFYHTFVALKVESSLTVNISPSEVCMDLEEALFRA